MPPHPGPVTLQDVARRAGVHPATVSRALGRPEMVSQTTRKRVLAAVDVLGFVPNRDARRLAGGRSQAIGVVVPDIANPYFASILQSIQAEATTLDLDVLIADSGGDPTVEARMLATLSRRVDGIVVCTPVTDLSAAAASVVQVNRQSRDVPSVVVDQSAIVVTAVDHLIQLGHHHIAVLRGPSHYWSTRQRTRAAQRLARDRRVVVELVHPVAGTFEAGRTMLDKVLAAGVTAVVAFNDVQAAGLLVAAHESGLDVPTDLSIVGSDGLDLIRMTEPTLTSVVSPRATIGRRALHRLVAGAGPRRIVLEPELSVGRSTGPPRASAVRSDEVRSFHVDAG